MGKQNEMSELVCHGWREVVWNYLADYRRIYECFIQHAPRQARNGSEIIIVMAKYPGRTFRVTFWFMTPNFNAPESIHEVGDIVNFICFKISWTVIMRDGSEKTPKSHFCLGHFCLSAADLCHLCLGVWCGRETTGSSSSIPQCTCLYGRSRWIWKTAETSTAS